MTDAPESIALVSEAREGPADISVEPLTPGRWPDLVQAFGERGAYAGCWCMWFRRPNVEWWAAGNAGNRDAFGHLVQSGRVPGLLAYRDGHPIGWVSVAPRDEYERISGDHHAAEQGATGSPVWAVVCFYVDRHHRGAGVAGALLDAAVDYARSSGATVLEAYPVEPDGRANNNSAYTGVRSMYERAGFRETGRFDRWAAAPRASEPNPPDVRRPPGRPVMRLELR